MSFIYPLMRQVRESFIRMISSDFSPLLRGNSHKLRAEGDHDNHLHLSVPPLQTPRANVVARR